MDTATEACWRRLALRAAWSGTPPVTSAHILPGRANLRKEAQWLRTVSRAARHRVLHPSQEHPRLGRSPAHRRHPGRPSLRPPGRLRPVAASLHRPGQRLQRHRCQLRHRHRHQHQHQHQHQHPTADTTRLPKGFTLPSDTPRPVTTAIRYAVRQLGRPYVGRYPTLGVRLLGPGHDGLPRGRDLLTPRNRPAGQRRRPDLLDQPAEARPSGVLGWSRRDSGKPGPRGCTSAPASSSKPPRPASRSCWFLCLAGQPASS